MDLKEIKKLLHHREPYLMVSKVKSHSDKTIESQCIHRGDEAHLAGHFPGAPIVPGAMVQEFCTQTAGILITKYYSPVEEYDSEKTKGHALGVLNKIEYAKFLEIIKPSVPLDVKVDLIESQDNLFKFKSRVYQDGILKAKLKFNLVNISDSYLTE